VCEHEGLSVILWSPLRGGWLSGKLSMQLCAPPKDSRIEKAERESWGESWNNYNNEHTWKVIDALKEVAAETGKPPAQVAIRWLLAQTAVTAPILGASTLEQLSNNLGAATWKLSSEQNKKLTAASNISLPYPYDFVSEAEQRR